MSAHQSNIMNIEDKNVKSSTTTKLVVNISALLCSLIEQVPNKKGKISVDGLLEFFKSSETQEQLTKIIKENLPKRPKGEKKLKDPNAPKRPLSSYFFFSNERREKTKKALLAEKPEAKVTDVAKALGAAWKDLSPKKKEKYEAMAKEAKEKYTEQMKDYERPSDEELADLDCNKKRQRGKSTTGKAKNKDPNRPKKQSGYILFCSEKRPEVKDKHPEMKSTEVTTEIARMWKELSEKKKAKYLKMAEESKAKYDEAMKSYTPPASSGDESPSKKRGRPKGTKKSPSPTSPTSPEKKDEQDSDGEDSDSESTKKASKSPKKSPKTPKSPAKSKKSVKAEMSKPSKSVSVEDILNSDSDSD
jgi:hypothetical protein